MHERNNRDNDSQQQEEQKKTPSAARALFAAGTSGFVGAGTIFIFEGLKKRKQSNQSLPNFFKLGPKNFVRETYRGVGGYAACLTPTSILQQMTSHWFKTSDWLKEHGIQSNSFGTKLVEAIFSGAPGGVASTLVENILLKQQLEKIGPWQAMKNLVKQGYARPFTGMVPICVREGIFGPVYLFLAPYIGKLAKEKWGAQYEVPAQLAVGTAGSLLSHPFDTIATTMQKNNLTAGEAANHLKAEGGVRAFYRGGIYRLCLFNAAAQSIGRIQSYVLNLGNDPEDTKKLTRG